MLDYDRPPHHPITLPNSNISGRTPILAETQLSVFWFASMKSPRPMESTDEKVSQKSDEGDPANDERPPRPR
jgi:hypothetical protein